jgi:hypothetical protein
MEPGGRVQYIDASPHRKGAAYYAAYRYLLGDYRPYLYATDDYGKSWQRLTDGANGIPADTPTRVVREDPDREGLLYAGTEFGMYISFDNGKHWQSFQLNLPNVPITDIKVHHKDLVVATQGRALWILDNITALHQLTSATTAANVHLYKPRDGYRTRTAGAVLGPNIDYYLPNVPSGSVSIEILDSTGTTVNTYSSDAMASAGRGGRGRGGGAPAESDDPDAAAGGGRGRGSFVPRMTKLEGMNRFVWDVRNQAGILVPPGPYHARLKVGSTMQTQPLTVLIDPNVAADGVTVADLKEQYEHNVRMRQLVADASQLAARIRNAQTKMKGENSADAAKAADVEQIAARLFTEPVRYGKPGLQAHITYLAGMTTSADQKIGRDAVERYATLRKELDSLAAQLDKIVNR